MMHFNSLSIRLQCKSNTDKDNCHQTLSRALSHAEGHVEYQKP